MAGEWAKAVKDAKKKFPKDTYEASKLAKRIYSKARRHALKAMKVAKPAVKPAAMKKAMKTAMKKSKK